MKRFLMTFLPLLLIITLCLSACEEFTPAATRPGHGNKETGDGNDTQSAVTTPSGDVDENPFTVTIMCQDQVYIPSADQPITVNWSDGFSLHTAPVGSDGIARIGGLDGDYAVTLTGLPEGYTYNPNIHKANNTDRRIDVNIYPITETTGAGFDIYDSIHIDSTGLYCVELTNADQEIFYEFAPSQSGTYSVESWMDVTANNVNPIANYYGANPAFREFKYRQDDGGVIGTYTKNFKLNIQIADENISKSNTGAVMFTFGIKATSRTNEYPVKVYFAVTLDGEFSLEHIPSTLIGPHDLVKQAYYGAEYEFVGAEFLETQDGNSAYTFDSDNYKLWEKKDGGDGYYHLYNTTDYPETHGYGPILYAKISEPCRFMDDPFTRLEYRGNKALTVSNGTENYKLFIEGFDYLMTYGPGPMDKSPYFCTKTCPCRLNGTCDSVKLANQSGACLPGCKTCDPGCNQCPAELMGQEGYGNYCNADGCYGVTEELKQFLQKYSISQLLFFDGEGFVETHETIKVFAEEEDQWLFACGYYKKK